MGGRAQLISVGFRVEGLGCRGFGVKGFKGDRAEGLGFQRFTREITQKGRPEGLTIHLALSPSNLVAVSVS